MTVSSDDTLLKLVEEFPAAADYLSTILLITRDYGEVHNTMLAERLGVSKPAVSQAVSRLKQKGLVKQDSYKTITLTVSGRVLAENIIKRHYLIEHLLISKLDYPWERADTEALRLQTVISSDLADHLYRAFNEPDVCPHGNPFPGSNSERKLLDAERLSDTESGVTVKIVRITEEGEGISGLLQFCHTHKIRPGTSMHVCEVHEQDHLTVRTSGSEFDVPWSVATHLCITSP